MDKQIELLITAFWIMLFGMVIVFLFLTTLIIAVSVSHTIVKFLKPNEFIEEQTTSTKNAQTNKGIMAAITAAVKLYRSKK